MTKKDQNNRTLFGKAESKQILQKFNLVYLKLTVQRHVSGCENCNSSVNKGNHHVRFQP